MGTMRIGRALAAPGVTCALSGGGTPAQTASGLAPAGATVTVSKNGVVVGTATATGSGTWSLALAGLANGDAITASAPIVSGGATAAVSGAAPASISSDFSDPNTILPRV